MVGRLISPNSEIYAIQKIEPMNDLRSKIIINIDKGLEMNILQKEDVVYLM
jgi:hypothetical protein